MFPRELSQLHQRSRYVESPAHWSFMMAAMDQSPFSLLSLEEQLSCSICLYPFDCPVTIPCGHNFCQDCILASWKDSYSCPQCRTHFPTKPELKKNTVLSTVVETFNLRSTKSEADLGTAEDSQAESQDVIRCDTCMEAEAAQTCLTCMASFCEEHLRPHRENPTFRVHQLSEPVGDLSERICPDHHKLMELFCSQHCRPICSLCLQLVHKGCSFMSPEEQRNLKESDLREKLGLLNGKIEKTETLMFQMNNTQSKLKDAATTRKTALAAVYQQIRDMLVQEEQNAQHEVDSELEIGQTKLQDHMKRLTVNTGKMTKARESINNLLSQSQTMAFLQASFNLPKAVKFDPHMPQVNLDSKKVTASQACSAALKQHLAEILKQPVEARLLTLKPGEYTEQQAEAVSGPATKSTGSQPEDKVTKPPKQRRAPRSHSVGRPPIQPVLMPFNVPIHSFMGTHTGWHCNPPYMAGQQTMWACPSRTGLASLTWI
ncbi:E3 ubiquitin/ISG15 ligase TRIM25-like isoform X4 [Pseudochaenichthys georgianus]|uniref:E3 ubiquitin/ISG15 ligase TRIM25-like isoform X4 n=1 Tax=Pseudochaenichthys georgianus TaxID=52239 RepID=UPI00146B5030|nr:E3 ubiquitin/ISG15 ligase TRIM25-like isoform X4 [Pseudochaenichthys georgianus]